MAVGMPRTATVPPRAEVVRAVVCFWQQVLTTLTSWGWCSCVPRRGGRRMDGGSHPYGHSWAMLTFGLLTLSR